MAARGSAAHRNPSNPLGGILRDLSRRSRSVSVAAQQAQRRPGPEGQRGAPGERGPGGASGAPGTVVLAEVVETADDGRASWAYGPLATPPVIGAVAVDDGHEHGPLTVVLERATATRATVRVWRTRPILGLGLLPAVPAGSGVLVHMTAVRAFVPDTLS